MGELVLAWCGPSISMTNVAVAKEVWWSLCPCPLPEVWWSLCPCPLPERKPAQQGPDPKTLFAKKQKGQAGPAKVWNYVPSDDSSEMESN